MIDVAVIADPAAAEAALEPARARLLAQLTEPASASMLAAAVGLPRQKVNYHLRTLERHGLVELVEERRKGNVTERLLRAAAASYVISPSALAAVAPDPARAPDRLSARWLLALAAQLVRDVGDLLTGAERAQKKLATFAMDGQVRFASAADRAAFTSELLQAVTSLVAKYHDEQAEGGREHHLVIAIHPSVTTHYPDRGELMGRPFENRNEAEVPASPDEAWAAIASGPGIDSWFMGRSEVQPGPDGTVRTVFGEYAPEHRRDRLGSGPPVRLPQRRGAGRAVHRLRVPDRGARGRQHRAAYRHQRVPARR